MMAFEKYLAKLKEKSEELVREIEFIEHSGLELDFIGKTDDGGQIVCRSFVSATGYEMHQCSANGTHYDYDNWEFPQFYSEVDCGGGKNIFVPIQHRTFNKDISKMAFKRVYGTMDRRGPWSELESKGERHVEHFFDRSLQFFSGVGLPNFLLANLSREYGIARKYVE